MLYGKNASASSLAASLLNTKRLRAESDRTDKREDDEQAQYHELSEFKWRLTLCRRHRFQRGDFFERLHDSDKDIEIESKESAYHINPTPVTGELARVTPTGAVYRPRLLYVDGFCRPGEHRHRDGRQNTTPLCPGGRWRLPNDRRRTLDDSSPRA